MIKYIKIISTVIRVIKKHRNCLNFALSFARRALISIEKIHPFLFARRALTLKVNPLRGKDKLTRSLY